ncbi:hypothetical protein BCR35DRAFT_219064 [Leucosporidium creatinivorum]|uniref:Uncharacterized protein n=1 Tax=Leucosporidium creatinivorum TaxID=106004 RepID=A0A1Y2FYH9_9BASI|nr:hypothetical protein BCR35DRAFT_219064 [Leucosporidium creatinivorum]
MVQELVEQAGLDVLRVTEEELEALGPAFECEDCAEVIVHRRWASEDEPPEAVLPIKTFDLTWSELVRHVFRYHPGGLRPVWKENPGLSVPRLRFVAVAEDEEEESAEVVL